MINFLIALAILVFLICIGLPIAHSMGAASVLYVLIVNPSYLQVLPIRSMAGINQFLLLAIPFFVLAGELLTSGGISERLYNFARLFVGRFRGGLAFVNVVASTIFGACSGSAIADVSGLGKIEIAEQTRAGYEKGFSAAVTAASALQAPLIPPSTTMMVYAGVMGVSAGALLIGGLIPGLLIGASQIVYILCIRNKRNFPRDTHQYSASEKVVIVRDGMVTMLLPVIIVGGITGGFVTATEAAAVAVAYALFLGFAVYRTLTIASLMDILWRSCKMVGNLFMIIAFANAFSWVAGMEKVPDMIAATLLKISSNPLILLCIVNLFYIAVGMLMDTGAAIILFAPILGPVMHSVGVDPIHFGVVTVVNLTIGLLTPPVGLVLFTTMNVSKVPFNKLMKEYMPFIVISYAVLFLISFVPAITIGLPRLIGYL